MNPYARICGLLLLMALVVLPAIPGLPTVESACAEVTGENPVAGAFVKMEAARAALARGDSRTAVSLAEEAAKLAPDSPEAYFFLARRLLFSEPFSGLNWLFGGLGASIRNFSWLLAGLGTFSTFVLLSLMPAMFAGWIVLFLVSVPLVNHEYAEGRLRWWTLALAAATAVVGLIPPLVFFSLLLWKYLSRKEKTFLTLIPALLIASYFIISLMAANLVYPASARSKALVGVTEGRDPDYVREVLGTAKTPEEAFSLAQASSRAGDCARAVSLYATIPRDWDLYYKVLNNTGVCYYRMGQTRVAVGQFEKARGKGRSTVEYNLSQMYRDELRFDEGEAIFRNLQAEDPDAVFRFMASGQVVVEETLPVARLWKVILGSGAEIQRVRQAIWKPFMGPLPLQFAPLAGILVFVLFGVFEKRDQGKGSAYRCRKCGAIRCKVCEKRTTLVNICQDCFMGAFQIGGVDPQARIARILRIQKNYDLRVRTARMLAALPGIGHFYAGRWWSGLFLFTLFAAGILMVSGVSEYFWVLLEPDTGTGVRAVGVAVVVLSISFSIIGIRKGTLR